MDVVWRLGRATAAQVHEAIPDAPSYSAVRALLRLLLEKGHLRYEDDGVRYVYLAVTPKNSAGRSALHHLVDTFFAGSVERAVTTLLDSNSRDLDDATLERLEARIRAARKEGK
jgi:predicted transcriptional regulator